MNCHASRGIDCGAEPSVAYAIAVIDLGSRSMPITAKLSKEFYDKFGHPLVHELVNWFNQVDATYRTELRDLNEVNFARFDAKWEQRATQLDAKWERRAAQLDAKWEQRSAQFEAKLEQQAARFDAKLEQSAAKLEQRTGELRSETAGLRADLQAGLARLEGGLLARLGMAEGRLARLTLLLWIATLGTLTGL